MDRLKGKVAVITGGAKGIGLGTAQLFAEEGARVIIADREKPAPDDGNISFFELDVTDEAGWAALIAEVIGTHGQLDVLVNNAGVINYDPIETVSRRDWDRVVGVDQTGVFLGMRAALGPMLKQGAGSIINVSSAWGVVGAEGVAAYQAAKGGVRGLTRNGAITYAKAGVRVNTIVPGWITTPLTDAQAPETNAGVIAITPLGHGGEPRDIGYGCVYLASDESRFVTGSELVIDGGLLAG